MHITLCACAIAVLHEQWMCLGIQRNTHITGNNLIPISVPIHFHRRRKPCCTGTANDWAIDTCVLASTILCVLYRKTAFIPTFFSAQQTT